MERMEQLQEAVASSEKAGLVERRGSGWREWVEDQVLPKFFQVLPRNDCKQFVSISSLLCTPPL